MVTAVRGPLPRKRQTSYARVGVSLLAAVVLLVIGGTGLYAWRPNASLLGNLKEGLGSLHHTLQGTLGGRSGDIGPQESTVADANNPWVADSTPPSANKVGAASGSDASRAETQLGNRAHPAPPDLASGRQMPFFGTETRGGRGGRPTTATESLGWKEAPMVVRPGSTIVEIAASVYGPKKTLGLDLIKEFYTHIDNLNWVLAGQKLWVPPLARETLVRSQPDGSFNLILASFHSAQQAEQFAYLARTKGYNVVVTPRKISASLLLFRVEIEGLRSEEAVGKAWEIASTNQWIAYADNLPGRRF
jgi:hypothetical protein